MMPCLWLVTRVLTGEIRKTRSMLVMVDVREVGPLTLVIMMSMPLVLMLNEVWPWITVCMPTLARLVSRLTSVWLNTLPLAAISIAAGTLAISVILRRIGLRGRVECVGAAFYYAGMVAWFCGVPGYASRH